MKIWCIEKPYTGPEKYFSTKTKAKNYVKKIEPEGFWSGDEYWLNPSGAKKHHIIYGRLPEYMITEIKVK